MKPKVALFLIFISLSMSTLSAQNWQNSWDTTKADAQQLHKNILLNFSGSDWCVNCIRLHKNVLDTPEFISFANDNLIMYNADFPRNKKNQLSKEMEKVNNRLAETYNNEGHFPLTVLLSPDLKILKIWDGYYSKGVPDFIAEIKSYNN